MTKREKFKRLATCRKAVLLYILTGVFLFLLILSNIRPVSEYVFARGLTRAFNFILSRVTAFLPFSVYEFAAMLLILAGTVCLAFLIVFLIKKQFGRFGKYLYRLGAALLCVLSLFTISYGALYHRDPLAKELGLSRITVTDGNLFEAANAYIDILLASEKELDRAENGDILLPYDFEALAEKIETQLSIAAKGYLNGYSVRPKKVLTSDLMSYLGISGIYFPFTAEANINMNCSPYELGVVMAHELSHAKGVSRENEANLLAYYALLTSSDAYLRYSASMDCALTLLSSMKKTDAELYTELKNRLPETVLKELQNDNERYHRYDGFIRDISHFFNNLFLKANGVEGGTLSYSDTVSYLVDFSKTLTSALS